MIWVSDLLHWTGSEPIGDSEYNLLLSIVHGHHIEICLSKCPWDHYLAQYYSPCIQHRWVQYHGNINGISIPMPMTQLYITFKPNDMGSLHQMFSNIQNRVIDIKPWMTAKNPKWPAVAIFKLHFQQFGPECCVTYYSYGIWGGEIHFWCWFNDFT